MTNQVALAPTADLTTTGGVAADITEFVTVVIDGQLFGIPVLQVQDVLNPQKITKVPLAPPQIAGVLNLRGRIVTAIDVRTRLGLSAAATQSMSVVVEFNGELFSLLVDSVGEVMYLRAADFEASPPTLGANWREVAGGIYRLDGRLLIVLDVAQLLAFTVVKTAEAE